MKKYILFIGFIMTITFLSCNRDEEIGVVKIEGIDDAVIRISNLHRLKDSYIMYQIEDGKGDVLVEADYLDVIRDEVRLNDFYAYSDGSLLYLCYSDSNEVFVIHDLQTGMGFPHVIEGDTYHSKHDRGDSLFNIISKKNPGLVKSQSTF